MQGPERAKHGNEERVAGVVKHAGREAQDKRQHQFDQRDGHGEALAVRFTGCEPERSAPGKQDEDTAEVHLHPQATTSKTSKPSTMPLAYRLTSPFSPISSS